MKKEKLFKIDFLYFFVRSNKQLLHYLRCTNVEQIKNKSATLDEVFSLHDRLDDVSQTYSSTVDFLLTEQAVAPIYLKAFVKIQALPNS